MRLGARGAAIGSRAMAVPDGAGRALDAGNVDRACSSPRRHHAPVRLGGFVPAARAGAVDPISCCESRNNGSTRTRRAGDPE